MNDTNLTFEYVLNQYKIYRTPAEDTFRHIQYLVTLFRKENPHITFFTDTTKDDLNIWKQKIIGRAAEHTCNNYLRHLKVLYKFAYEEKYVTYDLFFKFKFVPVTQKGYKSISKKNIREIIEFLGKDDNPLAPGWFWTTFIKTLFYSGMRRRQIVFLKWENINFDQKIISLKGEGSKNKKSWDIPMHTEIFQELNILRSKTMDVYAANSFNEICDLQVFNITIFNNRYKGNELKSSQVSGFFRNLYNKTNIRCSSHRYRHRITTDLVNSQENINDIRDVQHMLGHSDLKTTLTYVEKNTHKLRNAMENQVI